MDGWMSGLMDKPEGEGDGLLDATFVGAARTVVSLAERMFTSCCRCWCNSSAEARCGVSFAGGAESGTDCGEKPLEPADGEPPSLGSSGAAGVGVTGSDGSAGTCLHSEASVAEAMADGPARHAPCPTKTGGP